MSGSDGSLERKAPRHKITFFTSQLQYHPFGWCRNHLREILYHWFLLSFYHFIHFYPLICCLQISCGDIFRGGPSADAIVSPANSFGFMDGGIDMVRELAYFILAD